MSRLSIVNQQRWQRFKHNRRGYYSLWLFSILFIISLGAEIIANDKPLLVRYNQQFYLPVLFDYAETTFGGQFATATQYQDPYVQAKLNAGGWIIWAPIRFSYHTLDFNSPQSFPAAPSARHLLGTDDNGRDVLAGIIYGFRLSMLFALALAGISSLIGISAGALQGYYGGKTDLWGQRFIEVWSGMPTLFLIILLSSVIQPNFFWLLAITVLFGWMGLVGVVRVEFLKTRNFDYIRAAKAMGVSDGTIMRRHMLPNAMVATLTYLPFILCGSITTLASLDFLGFGLPTGAASLGQLLLQGKNNLQAPWLGISAFMVLSTLLSMLIFIGEAIRDAFNPARGY